MLIGRLLTEPVAPGAASVVGRMVALGRVSLAARQSLDFSGWLDALPLGYWARFTTVKAVRLEVTSSAPVDVTVRISNARGHVPLEGNCRDVASGRTREGRFAATIDTAEAAAGGWAWPIITAAFDDDSTDVAEVSWQWVTDDVVPQPNSLAVAITTFDRTDACLRQLGVLAAAAQGGGSLDGVLGRVILVDQGTMPVAESAGFGAVQESLGDRLTVIRQRNLGGSGGFARGLHEGLTDSRITHVALLGDDAVAQPERLAHAWAFAQAARSPTLVGGQTVDDVAPKALHRLGAAFPSTSQVPPSVDFLPWRMCLVPRAAVEAIGLPLPFFLKWDDVEYGLRATAAGFPSVVLPGAVVWHDSLAERDAESGWQAYFLLRNRIVTALLHDRRPTVLVAQWMALSLRYLARREPAAAAMHWAALKDVLHGPGWLHRDLETSRERAVETAGREIVAPHPVSALAGSVTAGARLLRRWPDLAAQYRAAVPEATSDLRWVQTFTAASRTTSLEHPVWSIVVTSFDSMDMFTRHWDGLIEAGLKAGVPAQDVEVIVVDNADQPEVEAFAREQGFAYLPMGSNVGLSAANNRGAEHATGDYLLFANPDLGVVVGDLSILKAEIDRTGGIVAPRVDFVDGTPQSAARGEPYLLAKLAHRGLAPKAALDRYLWPVGPYESGPVVWCAGGATSLSREVFDRIGGWPEEYFLYMEDVELGVRAGRLGIQVSVTAALRWVHEWRGDSRQRFNRGQLLHLRSALRFYARYPKYLGWPR
jgi:GT2 family glycosyltransferase